MRKQLQNNAPGGVDLADGEPCPLCGGSSREGVGRHIRTVHGKVEWERTIIAAKDSGVSDREIGRKFNVSFNTLSRLMLKERGSGSFGKRFRASAGRSLQPVGFTNQTTALWSFRDRGSWAVHDGHYRGNWSPYIPRNIILRYTKPGERVLDCFVGGGTTAIESFLLERVFTGLDINPEAVRLSNEAIATLKGLPGWNAPKGAGAESMIVAGDAMHMTGVRSRSIDLICTHPPYAEIIKYSEGMEADLSSFNADRYLEGMRGVASECLRVLKPSGRCAILVGDKRKQKRVVPLGFSVIQGYLDNGFQLEELIIKRQFNTRTSGLWYNKAIKWKFLLMAHEYLPVFSRSAGKSPEFNERIRKVPFNFRLRTRTVHRKGWTAESSTVWKADPHYSLVENFRRLTKDGKVSVVEESNGEGFHGKLNASVLVDLTPESGTRSEVERRRGMLAYLAEEMGAGMQPGALLGIITRDVRSREKLWPVGFLFWKDMRNHQSLALREIVVTVGRQESPQGKDGARLNITHGYLLIYEKT